MLAPLRLLDDFDRKQETRRKSCQVSGVDIYTVNKLMCHETLQVTRRYAHLADAHLQQVVERLPGVTASVQAPTNPHLTFLQLSSK